MEFIIHVRTLCAFQPPVGCNVRFGRSFASPLEWSLFSECATSKLPALVCHSILIADLTFQDRPGTSAPFLVAARRSSSQKSPQSSSLTPQNLALHKHSTLKSSHPFVIGSVHLRTNRLIPLPEHLVRDTHTIPHRHRPFDGCAEPGSHSA